MADGATVLEFQVGIDCDGCKKKLRKIISKKIPKVEEVHLDRDQHSDQHSVKLVGHFDQDMVLRSLSKLGRKVTVTRLIPPKKKTAQEQQSPEPTPVGALPAQASTEQTPTASEVTPGMFEATSAGALPTPAAFEETLVADETIPAVTAETIPAAAAEPTALVTADNPERPKPVEIDAAFAGFDEGRSSTSDTAQPETNGKGEKEPLAEPSATHTNKIVVNAFQVSKFFVMMVLRILWTLAFVGSLLFCFLEKKLEMLVKHTEEDLKPQL